MKIFQIVKNLCHYDMTPIHPTLASTIGRYAPNVVIVEAPDYVFEGWGYNPDAEGDDRFIKPTPPEGWLYDDATGTFYPADGEKPKPPTQSGNISELTAKVANLEEQLATIEAVNKTLLGVE